MVDTHIPPVAVPPNGATQADIGEQPRGLRATMTHVGNNIDLITLYTRQKDWYKIFEVAGAIFSRAFTSIGVKVAQSGRKISEMESHLEELGHQGRFAEYFTQKKELDDIKALAAKRGSLGADAVNTGLQTSISMFSTWWEQNQLLRTYKEALKQELGKNDVTFDDLKKSDNPIIRHAADYYQQKALYRILPDFLGLVKFVPEVLKMTLGKENKITQAFNFIEKSNFSGIDLALGGKSAYFLWYFIARQTGGNYVMMKIWNKTEGVLNKGNLTVNQNVNPGELVTQEEITSLYREIARERKLPDFTIDDPLTARLFEQIARYLNHNYIPQLYEVKRSTLDHSEMAGSHFTHADLVTLFGTEGINIRDAYASALRIEVLARGGIEQYRQVNARLAQLTRPDLPLPIPEERLAQDQPRLEQYLNQLDQIGKDVLGEAWPAPYITKEIRHGTYKAFGVLQDERPLGKQYAGPDREVTPQQPHASNDTSRELALRHLSDPSAEALGTQADVAGKFTQNIAPRAALTPRGESHAERAQQSQGTAIQAGL